MDEFVDDPEDETGPLRTARVAPDPIWHLAERGDLSREHLRAVAEIRQVVAHITQPVAIRISDPLRVPGKQPPSEQHHSDRLIRIKKRYLAWIDELGRQGLASWSVFDVVIDEISFRMADRCRHKRHGTTKHQLIDALDLYCAMAGWLPQRDAAE